MKKFLIALTLVFLHLGVFAQPGEGDDDPPGCDNCPIDGGISILIAGGIAIGMKGLQTRQKERL